MKDSLNDYYGSRYELRNQSEAVEGRVSNMLSKLQHMYALQDYDGNMQWLLLSVKIQKMISVWWFANKVTYHIDAERNPTGSIVGRTPNNEERSYYKMEV